MTSSYLLFLGRSPELSFAEIVSFIPDAERLTDDVVRVKTSTVEIDGEMATVETLITILGGTVKIAKEQESQKEVTAEALATLIYSDKNFIGTFGISTYGTETKLPKKLIVDLKNILTASGMHARFLLPQHGNELSTVVLTKQQVYEISILFHDNTYVIGTTVAVQDFEAWNMRDYGRPYADPKSGMLPPKIARIAVNLGLRNVAKGKVLCDPFCGMGTIVGEAGVRGASIIGSDYDGKILDKSEKNIKWLFKDKDVKRNFFISDATHISSHIPKNSVDCIITEPFMGTTKLGEKNESSLSNIKNIMKGLEKLYIGCFREWTTVLKPNGRIVIAIPSVTYEGREYSVKNIIDSSVRLGYTKVLGPLPYSRPQATVKRQFFVFEKR